MIALVLAGVAVASWMVWVNVTGAEPHWSTVVVYVVATVAGCLMVLTNRR